MTTNVNKVIKRLNNMRSDMVSGNLHVMHNMKRADQNAAILDSAIESGAVATRTERESIAASREIIIRGTTIRTSLDDDSRNNSLA